MKTNRLEWIRRAIPDEEQRRRKGSEMAKKKRKAAKKARVWEGRVSPMDDENLGYRIWLNSTDGIEFPKWMRRKHVRITEITPRKARRK